MAEFEGETYYEVLEVNENASVTEIRNAYRRLAKEYHPDTLPEEIRTRRLGRDAEERFKQIGEAFNVLNDSERRRWYDTVLASARSGVESTVWSDVGASQPGAHHTTSSAPPPTPPPPSSSPPSSSQYSGHPARAPQASAQTSPSATVVGIAAGTVLFAIVLWSIGGSGKGSESAQTTSPSGARSSVGSPPASSCDALGIALVAAAETGDEQEVQRLLAVGATPRCEAPGMGDAFGGGYTALTMALLVKEPDRRRRIVTRLLEGGADPNGPGAYGGTVLGLAMQNSDDSVVHLLRNAGGRLPANSESLLSAAASGSLEEVRALVAAGVGVNEGAGYKFSEKALTAAARAGHSDVVRFLLAHGADQSAEDENGLTALGYALRNKHDETASVLREAGGSQPGSGYRDDRSPF